MKKLISLLILLLLPLLPALAEPMVLSDGYTAWLGESGYMYLQDPLGVSKVLRYPMADILSIADGNVYALAQDGRLFAIRLDGTQTLVAAESPTEAEIAALTQAPVFDLTEGILSVLRPNGTKLIVASSVTVAAANEELLYFITQTDAGVTSLKSIPLSGVTNTTYSAPIATLIGAGVTDAISMSATKDTLAIVGATGLVSYLPFDGMRYMHPVSSPDTRRAVVIGTEVLRYTQNEQGWWLLQSDDQLPTLLPVDPAETVTRAPTYTYAPTYTPVPTATPTPTRRPTATPKPTATPEPDDPYPRLEYGDRGSDVRAMQRRLSTLGYPVGKVDGAWGKDTQLAVNLFQCAMGWKERTYMTSAMQEKLYSRSAPQYDPYAPLREGDEGTDVKLMQKALFDLGYLGTDEEEEVDSKYGPITTQAIMAFQAAAGYRVLEPTGYADADTLFLLFSEDAPRNPALAQPTDPNYPELILPGTPGNPVVPPTTSTDLIIG